jgi:hypothetical protein
LGFTEDDLARLKERLARPDPISRRRIAREFGWSEKEVLAALRELARRRLIKLVTEKALGDDELIARTARAFRRCYGQELVARLIASLVREGVLARLPAKRLLYRPDAPRPLIEALGLKLEAPADRRVPDDLAEQILTRLRELEEAPNVPVIVDRLRPAFPAVDKEVLDRAVVRLADEGRVYLVPVRVVREEDREMLIHDGQGNYYAGVGLRR